MAKKKSPNELDALAKEIVLFDSFDEYEIDELVEVLQHADHLYHNTIIVGTQTLISPLTDEQYDALYRYVQMTAPDHSYFGSVGSEVRGGKVKLPFPMGSLTQIYEGEIEGWVKQHNLEKQDLVVSDKLDGTSAMSLYKKGRLSISYSRGDGVEGADITRHISKFRSVPKNLKDTTDLAIRGEVILTKHNFEILRAELLTRGKREYKNARNMVAGLMNSSENDSIVYDYLHFVAYEIVGDATRSKSQQLEHLADLGFMTPPYSVQMAMDLNDEYCTSYLEYSRQESEYEIDGIVIEVDAASQRVRMNPTRDTLNPSYALKYKVADASNLAIAEVISVEYNASKHGYWKPRVNIKPVDLVGVTIQFATGFNARFIADNRIGPGAKIRIVRSGDVIPFITGVVEPAKEGQMPSGEWRWNETNVDAMMSNPSENREVLIQQVLDFFSSIDVPNLKEGSVRTIIEGNNYKDVTQALIQMIHMPESKWVEAIGANGSKIYTGIKTKLTNIALHTFLGATPYFGRGVGVRKWKKLIQGLKLEHICQISPLTIIRITSVDGFELKTAQKILDGMVPFLKFYAAIIDDVTFAKTVADATSGLMVNQKVCFTGVRSKELEQKIVDEGGEIASSVSSKTTILVCKDPTSSSGKMGKAKALGIKCMTVAQMETMLS